MLMKVTEINTAKTTFHPNCQPSVLLIYQPQAKQSTESTNQTAKFFSPKLNKSVFRKFDAKTSIPNNKGIV